MKRSEVKNHIIQTASTLFYNKGYNLTGINEIIKEAGIAKATLYNHFSSKEDICIAYLQYKNTAFKEEITDFVFQQSEGKSRIYALFDFLQLFFNEKEFNGCWCLNTYSQMPIENESVRAEIQEQKNEFIDFIKKLVAENLAEANERINEDLAKKIYILYEGAITESNLHNDNWPIEASRSICKKMIT